MKRFLDYSKNGFESGIVEQVNTPIIFVSGLPHIHSQELVLFETGQYGWVAGLTEKWVEIYVLSDEKIPVGTAVVGLKEQLSIPVGNFLIGKTIPPFLDPSSPLIPPKTMRYHLDTYPKKLNTRKKITQPFITGTTVVDLLVPLGRGQRELILGDRKTGKTFFVLGAIKKQVQEGIVPILALIGRKKNEIALIEQILIREKIRDKVIVVATSSSDVASSIFLTPFTAMAIAEYFANTGENTLVVLDDMTTHAIFYRELSLKSNKFPGRDSYPGDIFYTHARLLERAGNFKHEKKGEVSITCLPVVETQSHDLTGYIQTNLMGITDGHILFDTNLFAQGQRPAIHVALSVTRAGKQTRSPLLQDIYHTLHLFFAEYEQIQSASHFATELSEQVTKTLGKGRKLYELFVQETLCVIPEEVSILLFFLVWMDMLPSNLSASQARHRLFTHRRKSDVQKLYRELLAEKTVLNAGKILESQKEVFETIWQ